MNQRIPQEALIALGLIAIGLFVLVAVVNAVLVVTMVRDARREKPRLARQWSVAHVFLAMQAWVAVTLLLGIPVLILSAVLRPQQSSAWAMLVLLVIQNVAMVAVVVALVGRVYREPLSSAGIAGASWRRYVLLALATAPFAILTSDLIERLLSLAASRSLPAATHKALIAFQQLTSIHEHLIQPLHTPLGLVALIAVVGIIGPLGEEVFFRGLAQTALRRRVGPLRAAVASAAFFAVIHVSPIGLVPIFLMGLLLAGLYERTGTLAAPFALHAINNTAAVLLAYYLPQFTFWPFVPAG